MSLLWKAVAVGLFAFVAAAAFAAYLQPAMLIEFGDAFDFTGADFARWCREVGFSRTEVIHLAGPASAGIAYK